MTERLRSTSSGYQSFLLNGGLIAYAIVIVILGWSYGWWQIRKDRALTLETSGTQLSLAATALGKHIEAMLYDGVGAAIAGANELGATHASSPSSNDAVLVLSRMLTGGDYVRGLFIATPSRFIAVRRDHLAAMLEPPEWVPSLLAESTDTWVGKSFKLSAGDTEILIPVAKRTSNPQGEIVWAGALFNMSTLRNSYSDLLAQSSRFGILRSDGILLDLILNNANAINPIADSNDLVIDISRSEVFAAYQKANSPELVALQGLDPRSGQVRQVSFRRLQQYPLIATAGRNINDTLQPWRQRTAISVTTLCVASIVLLALSIALHTVLQRRFDAVSRSEKRFELAASATHDGIWEWEIRENYLYFSHRFRELLGLSDTDSLPAVPDTFWALIHPDDRRPTELALQRHLLHHDPYDVEYRLRTKDRQYRWFRARGKAEWDESGEPIRMAGSVSDIHDKKVAEQQLEQARLTELKVRREFTQNLLLAQEQERLRLANELHDSVGQNLSLIKNHCLFLARNAELPDNAAQQIATVQELTSEVTSEVISEVRAVAQDLRPPLLDELGLTQALETLVDKLAKLGTPEIWHRIENIDDVIRGTAANHIFRIVQEAINNTLKHAHAQHCRLQVQHDLNCVRLTIADDGVGFTDDRHHGIGLASIEERCQMLAATFSMHSELHVGTKIVIEIPITESADGDRQDISVRSATTPS